MTAETIQAQLKRWGISYEGYRSWATHNRAGHGAWGPVNGLMIHHTGSDGVDQRDYLYNGNPDLPGPLCHLHIDRSGKLWLIGWGRANHAGGGDPKTLAHVINEDYTGVLTPHYHEGSPGAADGNVHFYGVEIGYSGEHGMSSAQYSTLMKLAGAIFEWHTWTEKSAIGHSEWSNWKWDPGCGSNEKKYDMADIRADIKKVLVKGPVTTKPTEPPVTADAKDATYKSVWDLDAALPPKGHAIPTNATWTHDSILRFTAEQAEAALTQARSNGEQLTKIMKHLGIS